MAKNALAAVGLSLLLSLAACGDDDADRASRSTSSSTAAGSPTSAGNPTTSADASPGAPDPTRPDDPVDPEGEQPAAEQPQPDAPAVDEQPAAAAAPDLASAEICGRLPADVVAAALGVGSVASEPRTTPTPQCAYRFERGDGVPTNATVSALRTDGDLEGRTGPEAFAYVVDLNRRAADGNVTETPLEVGDDAALLTGANLHLGVVRLGARVVTAIVEIGAADASAASALTEALVALAPR